MKKKSKIEKIIQFIELLEDLLIKQENMTFLEWFPELIKLVKLDQWLLTNRQKYQWLQELNAFYGQIKSLSVTEKNLKLERFLQVIEAMKEQGLPIQIKVLLGSKAGVVLSTAHGSKGKEWEYVFLPEMADKIWGNARAPHQLSLPEAILRFQSETKEDKNADDRRLFYVSLTRAKKGVYLSFAQTDETKDKKQNLSQFAGELLEIEGLVNQQQSLIQADQIEDLTSQYVLPSKVLPGDDHFLSWLKQLVNDFKLSPTALDSYLKDPQDFLFNNILKVPRAKTASLAFGTAMHSTLEYVIRWWQKNHQLMTIEQIIQHFEQDLGKEVLTPDDFFARLKAGKRVLSEYFAHFDQQINPIKLEYNFGSSGREIVLDSDIKLTGKLDRIDLYDLKKNIVKVVDYKTGKVKSPGQIEGKTYQNQLSDREKTLPDAIKGSLKRQLLFYKLLSQLDPHFQYQVNYGELDFVEGFAQSGKSGKVIFELKDEDVELLKQLIREVMKEIRELRFLESD